MALTGTTRSFRDVVNERVGHWNRLRDSCGGVLAFAGAKPKSRVVGQHHLTQEVHVAPRTWLGNEFGQGKVDGELGF